MLLALFWRWKIELGLQAYHSGSCQIAWEAGKAMVICTSYEPCEPKTLTCTSWAARQCTLFLFTWCDKAYVSYSHLHLALRKCGCMGMYLLPRGIQAPWHFASTHGQAGLVRLLNDMQAWDFHLYLPDGSALRPTWASAMWQTSTRPACKAS